MTNRKTSAVDKLVFRIRERRVIRLPLKIVKPSTPLSSTLLLAYGFLGFILLGTILLLFPFSSRSGEWTSPVNALFTATSAVCVTGLTVFDTGSYWSSFGQGVLLGLIQIGGFGIITGTTVLMFAINGRFGLKERLIATEQVGVEELGGVLGIVFRLAIFSLVAEGIGALILYLHWLTLGTQTAPLWTAIFQAVSSFNNSGMDVLGTGTSLMSVQGDAIILLTTALLIIAGSTGYVVFADVFRRRKFNKFYLDTKLVLTVTGILLTLGTLFYLLVEWSNPGTLGPMSFPQKLLVAFFQAVNPRTAGFTAVDIANLRQVSLFFTMALMFVGGASGSTAGGVKVNTIGVLFLTGLSLMKGRTNIGAFERHITGQTIYRALTLFLVYLLLLSLAAFTLSLVEVFSFDSLLFEAFSALGTVGLSTGITPALTIPGKLILTAAMFIGRLGPLALMAFLVHHQQPAVLEYPHESVRIG